MIKSSLAGSTVYSGLISTPLRSVWGRCTFTKIVTKRLYNLASPSHNTVYLAHFLQSFDPYRSRSHDKIIERFDIRYTETLYEISPLLTMVDKQTFELANKLWDYHHVNQSLEKSDCILVLGSHDLRVAERGAELYLQGLAPIIIFSGGLGNFTKEIWDESEADKFATVAMKMGVPRDVILIENKSTNTGENILFTQQLLKEKGLDPQSFIVVQKPYMERRSFATFKKLWPDKKLVVTSPQISFEKYYNDEIPLEKVINIMVGDLQRIKIYPKKGFQIFQEIPNEVWLAYEQLIGLGYDKHLMK